MHPIQRHILSQLITNSFLPYSKLKPKDVEGNLFMYHLKQIIVEGLMKKRADGKYELTSEGKILADKLSLATFKPRIQPKIVTLIVCQNNKGELLLYKRSRQPFLGLVGFPYGKVHLGEKIFEAALRELLEKTGLEAELFHRADVYLTTLKGGTVVSQMLGHVFAGKNPSDKLLEKSEIGECFWGKISDFKKEDLIPGVGDIYFLIKKSSKNLQFAEFTYHI